MSFRKRLAVIVAAAAVFATLGTARGSAQIGIGYPYPFPPYRYAGAEGSLRLEVKPREAEVYVDGYYAGVVDDFDGMFQRLRVEAGEHTITTYRDGFRPFSKSVYVMPGRTFKINQRMEPLGPGEVAEPRPAPSNPSVAAQPGPSGAPGPPRARGGPGGRRPPAPDRPPPPFPPPPDAGNAPPPDSSARGTLAIRVQPADAEVLIDGQLWRVPNGQDRLTIDASEGRHNIQIRKPGYVGYLTDVQVRRGETTTVDVTLRPAP